MSGRIRKNRTLGDCGTEIAWNLREIWGRAILCGDACRGGRNRMKCARCNKKLVDNEPRRCVHVHSDHARQDQTFWRALTEVHYELISWEPAHPRIGHGRRPGWILFVVWLYRPGRFRVRGGCNRR